MIGTERGPGCLGSPPVLARRAKRPSGEWGYMSIVLAVVAGPRAPRSGVTRNGVALADLD